LTVPGAASQTSEVSLASHLFPGLLRFLDPGQEPRIDAEDLVVHGRSRGGLFEDLALDGLDRRLAAPMGDVDDDALEAVARAFHEDRPVHVHDRPRRDRYGAGVALHAVVDVIEDGGQDDAGLDL
jgi:hypothetical protein